MVGGHSMGPGLQLVGARSLNFHLGKLAREFKLRPISIFDEIQMAIFRYCVMLQSRGWACMQSYMYYVCWCDLDPIQCQGQGHGPFELPTIAHKCTFPGISPPPLSNFTECRYFTTFKWPHISVLGDATVTWLGTLVLHVLCMLMWPWPDPRLRSRSRTIWTSDNCPKCTFPGISPPPLSRGAQNWQ